MRPPRACSGPALVRWPPVPRAAAPANQGAPRAGRYCPRRPLPPPTARNASPWRGRAPPPVPTRWAATAPRANRPRCVPIGWAPGRTTPRPQHTSPPRWRPPHRYRASDRPRSPGRTDTLGGWPRSRYRAPQAPWASPYAARGGAAIARSRLHCTGTTRCAPRAFAPSRPAPARGASPACPHKRPLARAPSPGQSTAPPPSCSPPTGKRSPVPSFRSRPAPLRRSGRLPCRAPKRPAGSTPICRCVPHRRKTPPAAPPPTTGRPRGPRSYDGCTLSRTGCAPLRAGARHIGAPTAGPPSASPPRYPRLACPDWRSPASAPANRCRLAGCTRAPPPAGACVARSLRPGARVPARSAVPTNRPLQRPRPSSTRPPASPPRCPIETPPKGPGARPPVIAHRAGASLAKSARRATNTGSPGGHRTAPRHTPPVPSHSAPVGRAALQTRYGYGLSSVPFRGFGMFRGSRSSGHLRRCAQIPTSTQRFCSVDCLIASNVACTR